MIISFFIILFFGFIIFYISKKVNIPSCIGLIILGVIIGNFSSVISESFMDLTDEIRKLALIIILLRGGLNLDLSQIKKVGLSTLLLSFLPATFEIIAITIFAPMFFNIGIREALLLGSVIAAVSPAIVVPAMLKILSSEKKKKVPSMILAASSIDDVYVIVVFTSFLSLVSQNTFEITSLFNIPISIITGVGLGIILGVILNKLSEKVSLNHYILLGILLISAILLTFLESYIVDIIPYSSLLSIIVLAIIFKSKNKNTAIIENSLNYIWIPLQILLFTIVGLGISLSNMKVFLLPSILLITLSLIIRSFGVYISLSPSDLTLKEKTFTIFAYLPKATVQAGIGGVALSMGLECGNLIFMVSAISILYTASIGSLLIEKTYKKLLD